MIKRMFAGWICLAAVSMTPLHAEYRTWSNTEGVKIEAELVKSEGGNVTLRLRDGRLSTFSTTKLSSEDQDFIKNAATAPSNNANAKPTVDPGRKARWLTKMDRAMEEAKETGLPILVLFTGTAWCPYCIKLEKEVFAEKEFKDFANQNLVLLMLDFPMAGGNRDKSKEKTTYSDNRSTRDHQIEMNKKNPTGGVGSRNNEELQKEFGVTGFPTYFLVNAAGDKLAKGGYHSGINPAQFAEWVRKSAPK